MGLNCESDDLTMQTLCRNKKLRNKFLKINRLEKEILTKGEKRYGFESAFESSRRVILNSCKILKGNKKADSCSRHLDALLTHREGYLQELNITIERKNQ